MNAYVQKEAFSPLEAMRIASDRAAALEAEGDLVLARAMHACARAAEAALTKGEEEAERVRIARALARMNVTRTSITIPLYD